mmetsp:Transcript_23420/g.73451  ORF Transcript_23420/g.73451 Transcript_23420/m.73451 type:complete len:483 (-) Transcript_23420:66-1514(-)
MAAGGGSGRDAAGAPKDRFWLAYWICWLLGCGSLFSWNAFITAGPYFTERFCGTAVLHVFQNIFSLTNSGSQILGLGLALKYSHLASLKDRILIPLTIYCLVFVVTSALVFVPDSALSHDAFLAITVLSIFLTAICGSIYAGGIFGLAACFPPEYTQALMGGQGAAGVIVCLASIVSIVAAPDTTDCDSDDDTDDANDGDDGECADFEVDYSAFGYFTVSVIVMASCIMGYLVLEDLPITQFYATEAIATVRKTGMEASLLGAEGDAEESAKGGPVASGPVSTDEKDEAEARPSITETSDLWRVLKLIAYPAFSVWIAFTVTIAIFPSTTQHITSTEYCEDGANRYQNQLFVPVSFLIFNAFDFAGRSLPGFEWAANLSPKTTAYLTAARSIFVPLFLLCHVDGTQLTVVFDNDAWPMIFMILFALSNGWLASIAMMQGPGLVPVADQELAGTMMLFFLTLGLFTGACLSFIFQYIATGSWV